MCASCIVAIDNTLSLRKLKDPNNGIDGNFLEGKVIWEMNVGHLLEKDSHVEASEPCS